MIPNRIKRVSSLLMAEISDIIRREIKDPRAELSSVMRVDVTKDLSAARVYVSVMGGPEKLEGAVEALNSGGGFIRRLVQERVSLRRIPELTFIGDDSIEQGVRMCAMLDKIKEEEGKEE